MVLTQNFMSQQGTQGQDLARSMLKLGQNQIEELSGKPASVQVLEGAGVKLRCAGPPLTAKPEDPSDFGTTLQGKVAPGCGRVC